MEQSPQAEAGAARPPSPSGGPRGRCVALICHSWGQASTFYTWNWAKQYLLRRGPDGRLDPSEQLFVVKVRWGPVWGGEHGGGCDLLGSGTAVAGVGMLSSGCMGLQAPSAGVRAHRSPLLGGCRWARMT